jgi:integrase
MVDPPSPRKKAMRTMTPAEVEVLLEAAQDNYYYPVIYTAVSTGLRQAELLGLRWRDVDLEMLSISVTQVLYKRGGVCRFNEPKTAHSRRRVAMTPKLALFLREYKVEREQLYQELGKPLILDDLVFTSIDNEPLNPSVVTHNFHKIASIMLLRGAKPKVISEALGHASVAFTMDTYSHIIEGMQSDAMALLDEVLPAGKNNVSQKSNAKLTPIAVITSTLRPVLASAPVAQMDRAAVS